MKQKREETKKKKKRREDDDDDVGSTHSLLSSQESSAKKKKTKRDKAGSSNVGGGGLASLLAQEAWLKELEKLEKSIAKVQRKLVAKADDPSLRARLGQLESRLKEMKSEESAVADKAVPAKSPSFGLKSTPSSGICKTAFSADEALRRAERNSRFRDLRDAPSAPSVTLQEVRMALGAAAAGDASEVDGFSLPSMAYGTSNALEKPYLRLTSAPPLDAVRPPAVLEDAFALAKRKWRKASRKSPTKEAYAAFCEQLKSIRQDLTVQHVRSELSVAVYETHARVALERGDMAEYTQCASCLRSLYHDALGGEGGNEPEFVAYRLLAALVQGFQEVSMELLSLEGRPDLSEHPYVTHALEVTQSVMASNCHRFFALYADAPRMSAYLMDALLDRVRATGLSALVAAYGRDLDLAFVCGQLGFDPETETAALAEYASQHGAVVDLRKGVLDPKASKASPAGPSPR